jgi:hypothetical protein
MNCDFAAFLAAQDRAEQGRAMLAPLCAWFEGHGQNQEVRKARDLLRRLAG